MFTTVNKMLTRIRKNETGFTLIELLIVVAIIGILAAIAIPQFGAYRIRAYNGAASSDARNIKLEEAAFQTDNSVFASTNGCTPGTASCVSLTGGGSGTLLTGPMTYKIGFAQTIITSTFPTQAVTYNFGLSSGVSGGIGTIASDGSNYLAMCAHGSGDQIFGSDSDVGALKTAGKDATGAIVSTTNKVAGKAITLAPVSTTADDLSTNWTSM